MKKHGEDVMTTNTIMKWTLSTAALAGGLMTSVALVPESASRSDAAAGQQGRPRGNSRAHSRGGSGRDRPTRNKPRTVCQGQG
ncbi:MAG: hypothetical protein ACFB6R_12390, partial [Alphaproteobacteria bacterium]